MKNWDNKIESVIKDYESGLSMRKVAEKYGVSYSELRTIFKNYSYTPRSYQESMKYYPLKYTPQDIYYENGLLWSTIPFAKEYSISSTGIVKGKRKNVLKIRKDKDGYCIITIHNENNKPLQRKIHRLVAECFLLNLKKDSSKNQVNHINGIKNDNRVENLEWCTPLENTQHALKNKLKSDNIFGINAKLTNHNVYTIYISEEKDSVLAKKFNVSHTTITNIKEGKTWKNFTKHILPLKNGVGFISWKQVKEELSKLGNKEEN